MTSAAELASNVSLLDSNLAAVVLLNVSQTPKSQQTEDED